MASVGRQKLLSKPVAPVRGEIIGDGARDVRFPQAGSHTLLWNVGTVIATLSIVADRDADPLQR